MIPVRHLLLGLASSSALYSGLVPALGLGEITLHSALNQPLDAEIELLEVGELAATDLRVRLAPADVFSRSGVDRLFFLNDLRFTPVLRGANSVIRVVSNQPVREPYLNFIVELARPNGQLLREYTVLLDPPGSSAYRTMAVAEVAEERPAPVIAAQRYSAPEVVPMANRGQRYAVRRGDSLWSIVAGLRTAGSAGSQESLMRDIHTLNPQAFAGGDINRLRVGADLLLPDTVTPPAALAAEAVAPQPLDAPLTPEQPVEPQADALALAQRRIDLALAEQTAENQQLQQDLADLQVQLQRLQAQLESKDRQLAELQARLDAPVAPAAPLEAPAAAPVTANEGRSWLGAALAALLLLLTLAGAIYWRVRRRPEPIGLAPGRNERAEAAPLAASPAAPATVASTVVPLRTTVPVDALEGANIYIAYGRFSEAVATLRKALDAQPQRADIRFRLLEVYARLGDAQAFAEQEQVLRESGFTPARIDQLKARHPNLHAVGAAEHRVATPPLAQPAQPAVPAPSDDFQLNLDDLSLDADWDLVSPFSPATRPKTVPEQPDAHDSLGQYDARSPFAESMLVEETSSTQWLQDELDGDFLSQPDAHDSLLLSDLDDLEGNRDSLSKLNLALAYIEQGSLDSACNILNEVISEGDDEQRQQARDLLARIA